MNLLTSRWTGRTSLLFWKRHSPFIYGLVAAYQDRQINPLRERTAGYERTSSRHYPFRSLPDYVTDVEYNINEHPLKVKKRFSVV